MTYVRTTIDIDLADVDLDDIVEHLEDCGHVVVDKTEIQSLYEAKLLGNDVEPLLKDLVYRVIGKTW